MAASQTKQGSGEESSEEECYCSDVEMMIEAQCGVGAFRRLFRLIFAHIKTLSCQQELTCFVSLYLGSFQELEWVAGVAGWLSSIFDTIFRVSEKEESFPCDFLFVLCINTPRPSGKVCSRILNMSIVSSMKPASRTN